MIRYLPEVSDVGAETAQTMLTVGKKYFHTPQDFKKACEGYVHFWKTSEYEQFNDTPVHYMLHDLITLWGVDKDESFTATEFYVRGMIYTMVSMIE